MTALRRRTLLAVAAGSLAMGKTARAESWATDVGIYTEPTLAPALRTAGNSFTAKTGIGVSVLTASATLLLEQIQHNAAHDVLIVPAAFMDDAQQRGFIAAGTRRDDWRNSLVIAVAGPPRPPADLGELLAMGPIAVTDPTVASSLDGQALLATLAPGAGVKILGAATTADAAFMLAGGAAHSALLYLTDVRAMPGLSVAFAPEHMRPVTFARALNPQPPSKNAKPFFDFLATPPISAILRQSGLEVSA